MFIPNIWSKPYGGKLMSAKEELIMNRKHLEEKLPLKIGTCVLVTDEKGRVNEPATIIDKDFLPGATYEYLVKFDKDIGWDKNLWTDITSDKPNLYWCTAGQVTVKP